MADLRICSVEGCDKRVVARGWCQMHYRRWSVHGSPHLKIEQVAKTECSVDGCGSATKIRRSLCPKHYYRFSKYGDPLGGRAFRRTRSEMIDWIKDHAKYDGEECLIWPFARYKNGYGSAYDEDGSHTVASRMMCRTAHGDPEDEAEEAAHSCGEGHLGCVHPMHLRWATKSENHLDKIDHGTMLRGSEHPNAKLSEDDVRRIRRLGRRLPQREISAMFGVTFQTVSDIVRGRRWAWLK